jgi:hypothetical protein
MNISSWVYFKIHGLKRRLALISHGDSFIAFYELKHFPASYDIIYLLIAAQGRSISKGLKKIQVVVVEGNASVFREENSEYENAYPSWQRDWFVCQVIEQMPRLAPLCGRTATRLSEKEARQLKESYADYLACNMEWEWNPLHRIRKEAHEAWRQYGERVAFRAGEGAKKLMQDWLQAHGIESKPIVLTVRDRKWSHGRNSNRGDWLKFAHHLKKENIPAVVIPDTERLFETTDFAEWELPICVPASLNTEMRLALCEHARMNFTVNTGPGTMLLFTQAPYRYFANLDKTSESSRQLWVEIGLPPESQLSADLTRQKIIWEEDSFENLSRELNDVLQSFKV